MLGAASCEMSSPVSTQVPDTWLLEPSLCLPGCAMEGSWNQEFPLTKPGSVLWDAAILNILAQRTGCESMKGHLVAMEVVDTADSPLEILIATQDIHHDGSS